MTLISQFGELTESFFGGGPSSFELLFVVANLPRLPPREEVRSDCSRPKQIVWLILFSYSVMPDPQRPRSLSFGACPGCSKPFSGLRGWPGSMMPSSEFKLPLLLILL